MKRKLFASFGLLLILTAGVFSPITLATSSFVLTAHAQFNPDGTYEPGDLQAAQPENYGELENESQNQNGQRNNQATDQDTDSAGCGLGDLICRGFMATVTLMSGVPFLLATVTGMILDFSLYSSIQSSTYTAQDGSGGAGGYEEGFVVTGWKLVRDFSNLIFIFALFVVAFVLILGLDNGEQGPLQLDPKKTVARVIIMALLVNFSFFLGRVVIETTNIAAMSLYNKISAAPDMTFFGADADDIQSFYKDTFGIRSISIGILSLVNPHQFSLQNQDAALPLIWENYPIIWFYALVAAFFSLFLVYIFGSIAILFIARTIGLFLGIILSPLAFVSYTIPFLRKQSYLGFDDWLKQFLGLAFMAPIFMFFLFISLQFFEIPLATGSGYLSSAAQISFKFAMVGFLLVFAKKITKDLSGKVGAMVSGAVTSIVTSGAMIAGAVATGGASAGMMMGRRLATQAAVNAGTKVLGKERVEAIGQRLAGTNFRSMAKTLVDPRKLGKAALSVAGIDNSLNASSHIMNLARLAGSKLPDQIGQAHRQGGRIADREKDQERKKAVAARAANINKIRDDKNKNLARIDSQLNDLRTKQAATTDVNEKANLKREIEKLNTERKNVENPPVKKAQTAQQPNNQTPVPPTIQAHGVGSAATVETLNVNKLNVTGDNAPAAPSSAPEKLVQRSTTAQPSPSQTQESNEGASTQPGKKAQNYLTAFQNFQDLKKNNPREYALKVMGGEITVPPEQNQLSPAAAELKATNPKEYALKVMSGEIKPPSPQRKLDTNDSTISKAIGRTTVTSNDMDISSTIETPEQGSFGGIQLPGSQE